MGGFVVETVGREPFPLNSEALELLVTEGLLEVPSITTSDIADRSKTNSFTRIFSVLQVSWMVAQCIGRSYSGLPVTPLEFLTALCIGISSFTYLFEWSKPKDVNVPVVLSCGSELSKEVVQRLVQIYARWYELENKDISEIHRIPFGAVFKYLLNDDNEKPVYVWILYLVLCAIAGAYNLIHLVANRDLFTTLTFRLWSTCGWVGLAVPNIFLAQLYVGKFIPDWLNGSLFLLLSTFYCLARVVPFGLGLSCFWLSMPIPVYYNLEWL
ncbi:hypothetical protein EG329_014484 [Mollisiaceae sp. DMI_Dod_QoI]|nr:hypothetical protein EG329_014484 [Helotiales sp. DMI_Dod_QoI]